MKELMPVTDVHEGSKVSSDTFKVRKRKEDNLHQLLSELIHTERAYVQDLEQVKLEDTYLPTYSQLYLKQGVYGCILRLFVIM